MYVSKQWLTVFESIKYNHCSFYLDSNDEEIKAILHSDSQPGVWVKSLDITLIKMFSTIDSIPGVNLLNNFMTQCPNVKILDLHTNNGDNFWPYFSTVLQSNGTWKELEFLGPPCDKIRYFGMGILL